MTSGKTPDEGLARNLASAVTGCQPLAVKRFATGSMHYVFEATFTEHLPVVVRIAAEYGRSAMAGASRLSELLRPLGVPLPQILAKDLDAPFAYLLLERLPGGDIGEFINNLPMSGVHGNQRPSSPKARQVLTEAFEQSICRARP